VHYDSAGNPYFSYFFGNESVDVLTLG
jgi:hypothetical protein